MMAVNMVSRIDVFCVFIVGGQLDYLRLMVSMPCGSVQSTCANEIVAGS